MTHVHDYLSTACWHAIHDGDESLHGYCRSPVGEQGPKAPGRCKFCPARCTCSCHTAPTPVAAAGPAAFPVDDVTVRTVLHALDGRLVDGPDGPEVAGAEFSLRRVIEMMSGYDPAATRPTDRPSVEEYTGGPMFTEHDIIRAFATELLRLRRGETPAPGRDDELIGWPEPSTFTAELTVTDPEALGDIFAGSVQVVDQGNDRALVWAVVNGLIVRAVTTTDAAQHVTARPVLTDRWIGGDLVDSRTGTVVAQELRLRPGVDPW